MQEPIGVGRFWYALLALCFTFGAGFSFGEHENNWPVITIIGVIAGIALAFLATRKRSTR